MGELPLESTLPATECFEVLWSSGSTISKFPSLDTFAVEQIDFTQANAEMNETLVDFIEIPLFTHEILNSPFCCFHLQDQPLPLPLIS